MNLQTLKELKNKRGKLIQKIVRITNKNSKNGLTFNTVNDIYKNLLPKYNAKDIKITAKRLDNTYTTLKNQHYEGEELNKYSDEYLNGQPKEIKDKLNLRFYNIDIEINF